MTEHRRADARRNREAILKAADEAFSEGSEPASLEEIARRAGLARATVYRHFPDRFSMANAVAGQNIELLKKGVADSRYDFREILDAVLTVQVSMRSLAATIVETPRAEQEALAAAVIDALTPAFRVAEREGRLRPGFELTHLTTVFRMLAAAVDGVPDDELEEHGRRVIDLLLDGIVTRRPAST